jgi:hypothetical protein
MEEDAGNREEAYRYYRASRDTFQGLVTHDPSNTDWARNLGVCHSTLGSMLQDDGDLDGASAEFVEFERIFARLRELDPNNMAFRMNHAISMSFLGGSVNCAATWMRRSPISERCATTSAKC